MYQTYYKSYHMKATFVAMFPTRCAQHTVQGVT